MQTLCAPTKAPAPLAPFTGREPRQRPTGFTQAEALRLAELAYNLAIGRGHGIPLPPAEWGDLAKAAKELHHLVSCINMLANADPILSPDAMAALRALAEEGQVQASFIMAGSQA